VLLGAGKRLFADDAKPTGLKLTHSRASPNGLVAATYVRDGEVNTGDYAIDPPNAAELARRERMMREG
jgi:hypothetical protein